MGLTLFAGGQCSMRRAWTGLVIVIVIVAVFRLETAARPIDIANPAMVRERAALALIAFPWQQLHYDVVFMAPRPGVRAMTIIGEHRIEIYARPNDSAELLAY